MLSFLSTRSNPAGVRTVPLPWLFAAALVVVLAACSGGSDESAPADGLPDNDTGETNPDEAVSPTEAPVIDQVSFSAEVLPIIESVCARCHTANGPGTTHLRLDNVGDVAGASNAIAAVVDTGIMPPWLASTQSVAFLDDWSLTADQRATITAWADGGGGVDLEPDQAVVSSAGIVALDNVDIELVPEAGYDGAADQPDEYRCFVYDPEFTVDTWIRGFAFVPDQTEVVHHAIGYLVPGSRRDSASQLDASQADNGGWNCFGSSGLGEDEIFLGWAPGQAPTQLPEGSGMLLRAGDFVVVQVHYHFDGDAPEDFSALRLDLADADEVDLDQIEVVEFLAPAEIPCSSDETGPLCDRDAAYAAAVEKYGPEGVQADDFLRICRQSVEDFAHMTDGTATSSCDLPARIAGDIIAVLGHEHELGTSFRMTLNPDTPDEVVLLDIPEWDFDWQFNYFLAEPISIGPSDMIRIECAWDRSLRPPELEPAYVLWADGTNDEMCFATVMVRTGPVATATDADAPDAPTDEGSGSAPFDALEEDAFDTTTWTCINDGITTGATVADAMYDCAESGQVATAISDAAIAATGLPLDASTRSCIAEAYSDRAAVEAFLATTAGGASDDTYTQAVGPFGACIPAGTFLQSLVPEVVLSDESIGCLDAGGIEVVRTIVSESLGGPPLNAIPAVFFECLSEGELSELLGGE